MPQYRVTVEHEGKPFSLTVEGERPPTPEEAQGLAQQAFTQQTQDPTLTPGSTPGTDKLTMDITKGPDAPAPGTSPAMPALGAFGQLGERLIDTGKFAAATGISAATSTAGTAVGALTSPVTGPVGPIVGEMTGAYAGRKLNVALGLEEPGVAGDIIAAAGPLASTAVRYGGRLLRGTASPAAQEIIEQGAEHGVRVGYADLPAARVAQGTATALEKVPLVGTGGFRAAQQLETKQAALSVAAATKEAMEQIPYKDLASVQAAAARGEKAAQHVLEAITNAGEDWTKVVQASGNLRAWRARHAAGKLYDRVEALAQGMGDVPLIQTTKAVDDALATMQGAKIPDDGTLRLLTDLREQLQSNNPYPIIRQLRSDLGHLAKDYYKGTNAVVGSKGVGILEQVKTAVERDLSDFATRSGNPELKAAAARADRFYREQVIPYKDAGIAKALTTDTPDETYRQFVQRGKGDRAEKFYKALDPKGQAAVRYGMVEEAMDKSLHPTLDTFSPAKFAKSLEDVREAYGVFFKGQDKWEMDGFTKLMRHVERAGQFAENPPTGQRLIPFLLGGGAVGSAIYSPLGAAAGGTVLKGTSWLLTSNAGRRLLLAASDATPGSPAMDRIAGTILREGTRIVSTEESSP